MIIVVFLIVVVVVVVVVVGDDDHDRLITHLSILAGCHDAAAIAGRPPLGIKRSLMNAGSVPARLFRTEHAKTI